MLLNINHVTTYSYDDPVQYALQKVRLRPQISTMQEVGPWSVEIDGGRVEVSYTDHFGNHTDLVSADPGTQILSIRASGAVSTVDKAGIYGKTYARAPLWIFAQPTVLTQAGQGIAQLAEKAQTSNKLDALHALSAATIKAAPYQIGTTDVTTTAEEALNIGSGVCQDHANIFVTAARLMGLPARYVSGYLMMNDRVDQDATHAWAEVHLDDLGWVGFDVSNGVSPDERYVRIAVGRDARDAAPISGLRMGAGARDGAEEMIVSLQVQQ